MSSREDKDIEQLKRDLSWKLLTTVTGKTEVDISSLEFNELRAVCIVKRSETYNIVYTLDILKSDIQENMENWYTTGMNNGSKGICQVALNSSKLYLKEYNITGEDVTTKATVKIYYK